METVNIKSVTTLGEFLDAVKAADGYLPADRVIKLFAKLPGLSYASAYYCAKELHQAWQEC